jgi:hypothetical protein
VDGPILNRGRICKILQTGWTVRKGSTPLMPLPGTNHTSYTSQVSPTVVSRTVSILKSSQPFFQRTRGTGRIPTQLAGSFSNAGSLPSVSDIGHDNRSNDGSLRARAIAFTVMKHGGDVVVGPSPSQGNYSHKLF